MRGVEGKEGKRRFGFSYILLVVAVLTYLCVWGYSTFAADWRAKADIPQIDPILKIIKGLRQYQSINATFPQTFSQVEASVWKHAVPPDYGAGGHSLVPAMKLRIARPGTLVDIGRIGDLSYVREDGDAIAIGALTRHHDLAFRASWGGLV